MPSTDGRPLPTGTVTFLFLDIERSTELLQELGPDYPALLAAYRELMVGLATEHHGMIFGSEGDGLFLAFPEAGGAVASAIGAQLAFDRHDWPAGVEVKVRMGMHTGTPTLIGDDYTGIDVHRAARIVSAGWGGQILMSDATQTLLADEGPGVREALELARSLDDPFLLAYGLSFQGTRWTLDGDIPGGIARHQECLVLARQLDNATLMAQSHGQLAMAHLAGGDAGSARSSLESGLEHLDTMRSIEGLTVFLDACAWLAFAENDPVRAMTALGSADEARSRVGTTRWGILEGLFEAAGIAAESDVPALARAHEAGRFLTPHEAIAFAMAPHHELALAV